MSLKDRTCPKCGTVVPLCNFCGGKNKGWAYHWFVEADAPKKWWKGRTKPTLSRKPAKGGEIYLCENHCSLLTDEFHDDGDSLVAYGPGGDIPCEECYDPW